MRGRAAAASIVANPILVGAVTVLVTVTGVFLAYNANNGLPFVPTYQVRIETPDAARLVVGNEVREGGFRIGQITEIETVRLDDGTMGATLTAELEDTVGPIPRDSTVVIRPRSALGLKYVDLIRGRGRRMLPEGAVLTALDKDRVLPPELDDLLETFTERTRQHARTNLETFGGGFAARGDDLNRTIEALPPLLRDVQPIMRTLADPATRLERFFDELADAAGLTAPHADDFAAGFTSMADTFEAFSRDEEALKAMISEGPPTLRTGIRELPRQRPFLRRLANVSDEIRGAAREIRLSAGPIAGALRTGTRVLPRTPPLNRNLAGSLDALHDLSTSPTTNLTLSALTATNQTLTPTLRYLGPFVTVCNFNNAFWTFLADHLSEETSTGTVERIMSKSVPEQDNSPAATGAERAANGEGYDPVTQQTFGDPAFLHNQQYGGAVDEQGNADCEHGQRGYPERLAPGLPEQFDVVVSPHTPGNQGTTHWGIDKVPPGQTFSHRPTGRAPKVSILP